MYASLTEPFSPDPRFSLAEFSRLRWLFLPLTIAIIAPSGGCIISIRPRYDPGEVLIRARADNSINIVVHDSRETKKLTLAGTPPGVRLAESADQIVTEAVQDALQEGGFTLDPNADVALQFDIARFDVRWRAGYQVPVTARVAVDVAVLVNGQEPCRMRFADTCEDTAWGGGYPAPPVAEQIMSQCLSRVIASALNNPEVLAAIGGYTASGPGGRSTTESGGSGFLVQDTIAVTNYHVVENAVKIICHLQGVSVTAEVIAIDRENDIAILKLKNESQGDSVFCRIADPTDVQLGQTVYALGYPLTDILGNELRVHSGVISSVTGLGGSSSRFQIEMSVHPGNSGGPLVNEYGHVIGVVTSKLGLGALAVTGDIPEGVAFAVKSNMLRSLVASTSDRTILEYESNEDNAMKLAEIAQAYRGAVVRIDVER